MRHAYASDGFGDCIMSNRYDEDRNFIGVWIDHADPRVLIAPNLLEHLPETGLPATFKDGVLRIEGLNQTVIYRITGRINNGDNWRDPCLIGEWPD